VRVDGIWITGMFATGETRTDRTGRTSLVIQANKVPILAAQGVWPTIGCTPLLAWNESLRDRRQDLGVHLRSVVLPSVLPRSGPAIQIHVALDPRKGLARADAWFSAPWILSSLSFLGMTFPDRWGA
jgi:hypothetical protein